MTNYEIPLKDGKVDYYQMYYDSYGGGPQITKIHKTLYNHALEEAAKVAKNWKDTTGEYSTTPEMKIAQAIRALKEPVE